MGIETKIGRIRLFLCALILIFALGVYCVRFIPGNECEVVITEGKSMVIEQVYSFSEKIKKFLPRVERVE